MNGYGHPRSPASGQHSQRTAVIYTRVSSDKNDARSVEEQEADCRIACSREGWPIRHVITDNDFKATRYKRTERPGYLELQRILAPGDVLVTWESTRGYRDLEDYLTIRKLCETKDVLLNYNGRTYDLSEGEDRFTTGLDALIGERYAEETRKRVLRTLKANIEAGRAHGRIPYGYKAVRDPDTGRITERIPNPEEANIIREATRRILDGETQRSICQDFNRREVPIGNKNGWEPNGLKLLLLRPSNAGLRSHYGEIVAEGDWEPLVTLDDYHDVCRILKDDKRKAKYHRGTKPKYLLSGIATCGVCNSTLDHAMAKGPKRKSDGVQPIYNKYRCPTKGHVSRATAEMDRLIERVMVLFLEDPRVIARLEKTDDVAALEAKRQAAELHQQMDDQISAIIDQALPPEMTAKALGRLKERMMPQIEAAEHRAAALSTSDPMLSKLSGPNAEKRWAALSLLEKRDAIRSALTITVLRTSRRQRTFDPETVAVEWRI